MSSIHFRHFVSKLKVSLPVMCHMIENFNCLSFLFVLYFCFQKVYEFPSWRQILMGKFWKNIVFGSFLKQSQGVCVWQLLFLYMWG